MKSRHLFFIIGMVLGTPNFLFASCENVISTNSAYFMALSSDERGYEKESEAFKRVLAHTLRARAEAHCRIAECGALVDDPFNPVLEEVSSRDPIKALVPSGIETSRLIFSVEDLDQNNNLGLTESLDHLASQGIRLQEKVFSGHKPWVFGNNGSRRVGNWMWNIGKAITFSSPLGVLSGPFVVIVTPVLGSTGGVISTISRYVERSPREITPEHAYVRTTKNKKVNKIYSFFGKKVPHLIFTQIRCQPHSNPLE